MSASYFKQLELGSMNNFIYLIGDPVTKQAAIVDPGWEIPTLLQILEADGYTASRVLITHTHFDHVMGLTKLLEAAEIPIHVHEAERDFLGKEKQHLLVTHKDGETIQVGELSIQVLHTPGHTPGSTCYIVDGRLLTGDTLFIRAIGRTDLPGGDAATMYNSLANIIRPLDDNLVLCPGHNYAETPTVSLGQEKKDNPFLACPSRDQFLRMMGLS